MTDNTSEITIVDKLAMAIGGGLVLFGVTVMGTLETLLGSAHTIPETNDAGEVVAHTTFDPTLRATIIALGLVVFLVYALYKVGTAMSGHHPGIEREAQPTTGE